MRARRRLCAAHQRRYRARMISRFLTALGAAALAISSPASAALSPAEQVMVRTVDAEQQRTIAMLQRWVDQNSGTMNKAGVAAVRDMVAPELQQLGFKTQWIDMRSEEHTSELQSPVHLVCRLLLEKKKQRGLHTKTR